MHQENIPSLIQKSCTIQPVNAPNILQMLSPQQQTTLSAAYHILNHYRAVLLCESTGSGKTFVAAALAALCAMHDQASCTVIAPAHMLNTWKSVLEAFSLNANFYSYQAASLGKIKPSSDFNEIWLLDEAHFLKNPSTLRYKNLLTLLAPHRICLITATPVSLSWKDMLALVSLCGFPDDPACCAESWVLNFALAIMPQAYVPPLQLDQTFSPEHRHIPYKISPNNDLLLDFLQTLESIQWLTVDENNQSLQTVPLLTQVLFHRLLSHRNSCLITLQKLMNYYRSCRNHPERKLLSRKEFKQLMGIDGKQQCLPFEELLFENIPSKIDRIRLNTSIDTIHKALLIAEKLCKTDDLKLQNLQNYILNMNHTSQFIIFTQYADTAEYLAENMQSFTQTALLTPTHSKLGHYNIDPQILLAMFSPSLKLPDWWHKTGQRLPKILICTDAFACGQNLQKASSIIHFDLPWNPSTMHQREGRIMRIGQAHTHLVFANMPASLPNSALRNYQDNLRNRLSQRQEMQRSWMNQVDIVQAANFLFTQAHNRPIALAKCGKHWIPVHPAHIPITYASISKISFDQAFCSTMRALQKKIYPIWNSLKFHAHRQNLPSKILISFLMQTAIFPQFLKCIPSTQLFTSENINTSYALFGHLPALHEYITHPSYWLCTTYPHEKCTTPQPVHRLSTACTG